MFSFMLTLGIVCVFLIGVIIGMLIVDKMWKYYANTGEEMNRTDGCTYIITRRRY